MEDLIKSRQIVGKADQQAVVVDQIVEQESNQVALQQTIRRKPLRERTAHLHSALHEYDIIQMQNKGTFNLTEVGLQGPIPLLKKSLKYEFIRSLAPGDFMNIRKSFDYYDKQGVNVGQFICIMIEVMFQSHDYERYSSEILTLVELFIYIDHGKYSLTQGSKQKVRFEQFTNFVIENQQVFANDEPLQNFKIAPAKALKDVEIVAEKVFPLNGYEHFSILDQSQKSVLIIDGKTFKPKQNISVGGSLITNVVYIKEFNALALATNDKHLNFYDIEDNKLVRRFVLEDAQMFLAMSDSKNILFSGSISGVMYEWSLTKIFSQHKPTVTSPKQIHTQFLYKGHKPVRQLDGLTFMLNVEAIEMLITGCNDTNIRLYEVREGGLTLGKILQGHEKGIKSLAFSEINKVILSCAFDFDVLVWNAYLDCPVAKLVGHEAPLSAVYCPQKHSIIISLDSKGIMKIWNCKTFQLIQNVVNNEVLVRTSISLSYKEESDLAIICMKRLHFYEFAVSYDPKLTDDKDITAVRYSHINLEIYIGTGGTIKAWSAEKGIVARTFKNLIESDIITMELDKNHRRIFFGSVSGEVLSVDAFTGMILNRFAQHAKEICYIGYSFRHSLLVTAGWDRIVKIHNDTDHLERIDKRNNVLRNIKNCHTKELLMAAYSDDMMLLATSSRDPVVRLWDFEKGFFQGEFTIAEEISCIHFLNPFPLLAVADIKGGIYIFIVNYHKKAGKLLIHWTNMYSIQKESQVTYVSSEYYNSELKMILGDQYGYVRLIKFNQILESQQIEPVLPEQLGNKNPFRIEDYNFTGSTFASSKQVFTEANALLPHKLIKQNVQIKAHNSRINYAHIVRQTNEICLLTVGADHLCKLWSQKGMYLGILRQGQVTNENWRFATCEGYLTKQQKAYKQVIKQLPDIYSDFLTRKRAKMIPFSASAEIDYDRVEKIDSSQIYKDLKEIDEYLRKYYPKSQKKLY